MWRHSRAVQPGQPAANTRHSSHLSGIILPIHSPLPPVAPHHPLPLQLAQTMCERSTQRQGLTPRDASNGLVALARAVPEFLRIEDPRVMGDGSMRPRSVAISRTASITGVAAKLKALAADPDAAVLSLFGPGAERAAAGTPGTGIGAGAGVQPSPTASKGAGAPVPSSPSQSLKPRALQLEGEEEGEGGQEAAQPSLPTGGVGGGGGSSALPPPPLSAKKLRPPGLPLPPPSPMRSGRMTPTRSRAVALGLGLAAGAGGPSGHGGAGTAAGAPGAAQPQDSAVPAAAEPADPEGAALLQKLLHRQATGSAQKAVQGGSERGKCEGVVDGGDVGVLMSPGGKTPGKAGRDARTPGRTAVQDAMLGSMRRSSARQSSRRLRELDGAEEAAVGGNVGEEEAGPKPKRLEELLG